MAKYVYGIDLGTTYSCIARINDHGIAEVINNREGLNITPSVVFFDNASSDDEKKAIVGEVAKANTVIEPENTISFVKTLMGKADVAITNNGRDITPAEVSSYILKKVAQDAEYLTNEEVKDVVITVPAYFGAAERAATEFAGELAGLNVLGIINEPLAAAIYYGITNQEEEKNILVYDLGGGTFDVTILKIKPGRIEEICKEGNHDLGGKDWDAKIIGYLMEQFREISGFDGEFDPADLQDLSLKAEKAKKELSVREATSIPMVFSGFRSKVELTLEKFNELTSDLLDITINLTDSAIEKAKVKGVNVDQILLVGGSTRMLQVTEILKSKYGMDPLIGEQDEAVAKGAAIYATDVYLKGLKDKYNSTGDDSTEKPPVLTGGDGTLLGDTDIITTTTKSYGVKAILTSENKEYIFNQIMKDKPFPDNQEISHTEKFGVMYDNMPNAQIVVYESDSDQAQMDVMEEFKLGEAVLELPPGMKTTDNIILTLTLDASGRLHVHGEAEVKNVRTEVDAYLTAKGIPTKKQKENIKKEMFDSGITVQ